MAKLTAEEDEFDVILEAAGDKKIQVIKEVRASGWMARDSALNRAGTA